MGGAQRRKKRVPISSKWWRKMIICFVIKEKMTFVTISRKDYYGNHSVNSWATGNLAILYPACRAKSCPFPYWDTPAVGNLPSQYVCAWHRAQSTPTWESVCTAPQSNVQTLFYIDIRKSWIFNHSWWVIGNLTTMGVCHPLHYPYACSQAERMLKTVSFLTLQYFINTFYIIF